ncbi:hypothetical protein BT63DRAFT_460915 [Microthyrium microscopicum]|uniref:Concanavalin A-like lectin/glucanase n=1 Tax=Microthyrium microscopicum TaxID=703497 RepID=A0A6A6TWT0_9PEZI|nr:hypothetical protein BT63DRAFT_460915 [Microthyrium microscopicum]
MITTLIFAAALAARCISASFVPVGERPGPKIIGPIEKRQLPQATWGHTLYLDAKKSEYTSLSVVYSPGKPPPNPKGSLFLWPGMFQRENYTKSNLIQTVTELHSPLENQSVCGAKAGQWCIRPFVVDYSARQISQFPARGKAIDADDKILIEYNKKPGENGNWTQKITNLSKGNTVLFEWERGYKRVNRLHLATEYQGGAPKTTDTQRYWNVTVTLKEPEPAVGSQFTTYPKNIINSSKPYSKDNGKSWHIDEVVFLPHDPSAAGASPAAPRPGAAPLGKGIGGIAKKDDVNMQARIAHVGQ